MCQKATLKSEILSFKSQNNLVKHGDMSDFFFKNHSHLLRILQNRYEIRKYFLFSPPNKTWTARLFLCGDSNFFWDSVQRDGTLKKWVEMHPVYCILYYSVHGACCGWERGH